MPIAARARDERGGDDGREGKWIHRSRLELRQLCARGEEPRVRRACDARVQRTGGAEHGELGGEVPEPADARGGDLAEGRQVERHNRGDNSQVRAGDARG